MNSQDLAKQGKKIKLDLSFQNALIVRDQQLASNVTKKIETFNKNQPNVDGNCWLPTAFYGSKVEFEQRRFGRKKNKT